MGFFSGIWKAVTKPFKKILSWLVPTPDLPAAQAVTVEKQGSDHPIPVVYGTRRIGGIKVHKYVTDADGGAKNEFLHLIIVFCEGPIEAISEIYFDGVSEVDPRWNKQGGGKWFTVQRCNGVNDQAPLTTGIPNWTADHRLQGLAYIHLRLQMDESQSVWRGEPEVTALIRGRKIYDPRNGRTSYSENLPLQLLDYLTNIRYGKGLSVSRLMQQSFIESAHWADEQIISDVTINGETLAVTHARISGNHVIDTGKSVFSNVKQMLSGMRGMMPIGSGQLRLVCEKEGAPVFFFSHNKSDRENYALITSPVKSKAGRKNDRYNRVIIRFPNKLTNYERDEVHYPDADDPLFAEWLAEDNGVLLEQTFEFDTITNKAEAYQMAEIVAKRSRNRMEVSFTASPPAIVVEPGDIVGISDDTRGWDEKSFRVEQCKLREDGDVDFEFIEHQNSIYPWSGVEYSERVGGTNLGDPTNIPAPTGLSIEPDPTFATSGTLRWANGNNAFVRRYQILVTSESEEVYKTETIGLSWSIPLFAPETYLISLRAVSSLNTLSPAALIPINLLSPSPPTDIQVTVGNFEIEAAPVLTDIGLGSQFEMAINSTADRVYGPGAHFVFVSLHHGTEYVLYARTVNAMGRSAWMSKNVTTLSDSSTIIDLIGEGIAESIFDDVVDEVTNNLAELNDSISSVRQNVIEDALAILDNADERIRRQSGQAKLQESIRNEAQQRETSVAVLRTELNNEKALRGSEIINVQQSITDLESTTATNINEVSGRISTAENTISAQSLAIQNISLTNEGQATAITSLQSSVTSLTNQQTAASNLILSSGLDLNGNTKATAILNSTVNGLNNGLATTQLQLSSTISDVGILSGRAFLGVSTVTAGKAVVNGIVIDGATNSLEFRADTFRLSNTAGVDQLYFNTSLNKWLFSGNLVAATFQTATSGYRAEMNGTDSFPFWYGTGTKTAANGLFYVDTAGNVVMRNASVQGRLVTSPFSDIRVDVGDDGNYLLWAGTGTKNDVNGIFWIKKNGIGFIKGSFFQGQIIESKFGVYQAQTLTSGSATAFGHNSDGKPVEINASSSVSLSMVGNTEGTMLRVQGAIYRDSILIGVATSLSPGYWDFETNATLYFCDLTKTLIDAFPSSGIRNYTFALTIERFPSGNVNSASTAITVKTFENKLSS